MDTASQRYPLFVDNDKNILRSLVGPFLGGGHEILITPPEAVRLGILKEREVAAVSGLGPEVPKSMGPEFLEACRGNLSGYGFGNS